MLERGKGHLGSFCSALIAEAASNGRLIMTVLERPNPGLEQQKTDTFWVEKGLEITLAGCHSQLILDGEGIEREKRKMHHRQISTH